MLLEVGKLKGLVGYGWMCVWGWLSLNGLYECGFAGM